MGSKYRTGYFSNRGCCFVLFFVLVSFFFSFFIVFSFGVSPQPEKRGRACLSESTNSNRLGETLQRGMAASHVQTG